MSMLVNEIREQMPKMLETLKDIVELESPSHDKAAIDKLVDYIAQVCQAKGMKSQVVSLADRGNHLIVKYGEDSAAVKLLILCHIDTVWPLGTIKEIPFKNENGILTGPGVFDMKVGVMQSIYALENAIGRKKLSGKQVKILFTSDEEIGSTTSREMIENAARESKCVLVLEPSVPPEGSLKTFRKGVGSFSLDITGRPSHAGGDPEKGISAITELAHQVLYLQGLADKDQGTTVNVGVVSGGTRSNVIPAKAVAKIDVRVQTLAEGERITRDILSTKPFLKDAVVIATGGINRPPMLRTEKTVEKFKLAQRIAAELGFELTEASTGGGSDGNFTAALGIPTIDGLGAVGAGGHAYDEHAFVKNIPDRTALLVRLLEEL